MRRLSFFLLFLACATTATKTRVADYATELHDSVAFSGGATFLSRTSRDFSHTEMLELRNGRWSPLPFADGKASGASVGPNGTKLYFTRTDLWDIWVSERGADGWSAAAAPLPAPVNDPKAWDCCAVAAANGDLYFSSNRGGSWDIYVARGGNVERVTALSTGAVTNEPSPDGRNGEWPSYVDPRGRFLLFSSIREGGLGGDDIYYALPDGRGGWLPPRNAGPLVNTSGYEDGATVRGNALYFSSREGKGASDVFRVPVSAVIR